MKVRAPGKLLLTGAYAVLEGAPAIVVAVDRYAVADTARNAETPSREVQAALAYAGRDAAAPAVDVSALYESVNDGAQKLGLGSSAAALVATLGARAAERGDDVTRADVRRDLFAAARRAHAAVQDGGSGVDVAASVFGGVLEYALGVGGESTAVARVLPQGLVVEAVWSGTSARTSDLRAKVDALRARDPRLHAARLAALGDAATRAARAVVQGDRTSFLGAAHATRVALDALGRDASAPIVPPTFHALAARAEAEGAAFFPSGAGGGDVAVYLGVSPPTDAFVSALRASGMRPLGIGVDRAGVRPYDVPSSED